MRGLAVRRARGILVVAVGILPWAVASQGGPSGAGGFTAVPDAAAAIESLATLPVVTADRPAGGITTKRTEGARVLWTAPAGGSNLHLPLALVHDPWPADPIARSQPLALHLAGRGPPLALAA